MNKIYRSVWNSSLRIWVAASELSASKGKGGRSGLVCAGGLALAMLAVPAQAYVVGGGVSADGNAVAIGTGAWQALHTLPVLVTWGPATRLSTIQ